MISNIMLYFEQKGTVAVHKKLPLRKARQFSFSIFFHRSSQNSISSEQVMCLHSAKAFRRMPKFKKRDTVQLLISKDRNRKDQNIAETNKATLSVSFEGVISTKKAISNFLSIHGKDNQIVFTLPVTGNYFLSINSKRWRDMIFRPKMLDFCFS